MLFEWDANKNELNIQKHGIDFSMAIGVFDDPNRLEEDSTQLEHPEIRVRTMGVVGSALLHGSKVRVSRIVRLNLICV